MSTISYPGWKPYMPVDRDCQRCWDIAFYEAVNGVTWGLIGPHIKAKHPGLKRER